MAQIMENDEKKRELVNYAKSWCNWQLDEFLKLAKEPDDLKDVQAVCEGLLRDPEEVVKMFRVITWLSWICHERIQKGNAAERFESACREASVVLAMEHLKLTNLTHG